jgi:hypothetical protein
MTTKSPVPNTTLTRIDPPEHWPCPDCGGDATDGVCDQCGSIALLDGRQAAARQRNDDEQRENDRIAYTIEAEQDEARRYEESIDWD